MAVSFNNYIYVPLQEVDRFLSDHAEHPHINRSFAEKSKITLTNIGVDTKPAGLYFIVSDEFCDDELPCQKLQRTIVEVSKGDTLTKITSLFGHIKNYHQLAKVNQLENPHHILAGSFLVIPETPSRFEIKKDIPQRSRATDFSSTNDHPISSPRSNFNHNAGYSTQTKIASTIKVPDHVDISDEDIALVREFKTEIEEELKYKIDELIATLMVMTPGFEQGEGGKKAVQLRSALIALKVKLKNGGISALEGKLAHVVGVETHPDGKRSFFIRYTNRRVRVKIFIKGPLVGFVSVKLYDPSMRISGVGTIRDGVFKLSDFKKALKLARKDPDQAVKFLIAQNKLRGLAPIKENVARRMLTQTPSLRKMKALSVTGVLTTFVFASLVNHLDHTLGLNMPTSAKAILSNMMNDAFMIILEKRGIATIGEIFSTPNALFIILFEAYGLIYDQACKEFGFENNRMLRAISQIGGYLATKAGYKSFKRLTTDNDPPNVPPMGVGTSTVTNLQLAHIYTKRSQVENPYSTRPYLTPVADHTTPIDSEVSVATGGITVIGMATSINPLVQGAKNLAGLNPKHLLLKPIQVIKNYADVTRELFYGRLALETRVNHVLRVPAEPVPLGNSPTPTRTPPTSNPTPTTGKLSTIGGRAVSVAGSAVAVASAGVTYWQIVDYIYGQTLDDEEAHLSRMAYAYSMAEVRRAQAHEEEGQNNYQLFDITAGFLDLIGFDNIAGSQALENDSNLKYRISQQLIKQADQSINALKKDLPLLVSGGFPTLLQNGQLAFVQGREAIVALYDIILSAHSYQISKPEIAYYREMSNKKGFHPSSDHRYLRIWAKLIARDIKMAMAHIYLAMPLANYRNRHQQDGIATLFDPEKTPKIKLAEKLLTHFGIHQAPRVIAYAQMIRNNYYQKAREGLTYDRRSGVMVDTKPLLENSPRLTTANVFTDEVYQFTIGDQAQSLWTSYLDHPTLSPYEIIQGHFESKPSHDSFASSTHQQSSLSEKTNSSKKIPDNTLTSQDFSGEHTDNSNSDPSFHDTELMSIESDDPNPLTSLRSSLLTSQEIYSSF